MTLVLALLAGAAFSAAPAASSPLEVCELLSAEDITTVQSATLKDRKRSEDVAKGLRFAQCFYATSDFVRSISLTVITDEAPSGKAKAFRTYWHETFNPQRNFGRKNAPRAISGFGKAAFWTGDSRAGVLYILLDEATVRLSVGGVDNEAERLERTKSLAQAVLRRLR